MSVALYARVSTDGQNPEGRLLALRAHAAQRGWPIAAEFVDRGVSGTKNRRPALDRLRRAAGSGAVHGVLVWPFDGFARSVTHLIHVLDTFGSLGIAVISLQEQFDTSTPIGHALFTVIGAMAHLERDLIRDRVKAGRARAKATGVRRGRPVARVPAGRLEALRPEALSIGAVARCLGVSRATIRRRLCQLQTASPPESS